jgi:hypothetical protein
MKKRHVAAVVIGLTAIVMAVIGGGLGLLVESFSASFIGGSLGVVLGLLAVILCASGRGSTNEGNDVRRHGFLAGIVSILMGLAALIPFFLAILGIARIS